jgi:O-antigen/teichoic acid export membrane protein
MDKFFPLRKKRHLVNVGAFGIAAALGQFMMMLFTFLLARRVGPVSYGFYFSSFSLLFLTSILFNNGLDTWLLNQKLNETELHETYSQIVTVKTIGGIVWAALVVVIAPLIRPDVYLRILLLINAVDIWTDAVFMSSLAVLNIQGKVKEYSISLILSRTFKLLSLLMLMFLGTEEVIPYAIGRAFISILVATVALCRLKPRIIPIRFPALLNKLKSSRFFALSDFLATIYMQIDITLLNLMVGSFQVGVYSPASSMINALFVLPTAVHLYTLPLLTRYYYDDPPKFVKFAKNINFLTLILGLILCLGVYLLGGWLIVRILGTDYEATSRIIVVLSPILLMKSLEFGFASIIVAGGAQKKRVMPQIFASFVNVLFNLILIPRFGIVGAAKTYLISESILMLWYGWIAYATFRNVKCKEVKNDS